MDELCRAANHSSARNCTAARSCQTLIVLPPRPAPTPPPPGKWARGGWCGSDEQEKQIKEETQATLRCFPFDQPAGPHTCFMTGQPAAEVAIFAKSY